jgi:hypothetical protein
MHNTATEYNDIIIPTYIINLKERKERMVHISEQFINRSEFDVKFIEACTDKIGAVGLWKSIVKIVKMAVDNEDDVIVICEDDHTFSDTYSKEFLIYNIIEANEQGALLLNGGVGGFGQAFPLSENRYWVSTFISTQFIILYKPLFEKILNYKFKKTDVADLVLSEMTSHKMILYPFISYQKEFGYSDITPRHNEEPGLVSRLFARTEVRLEKIRNAYLRYRKLQNYQVHEEISIL